MVAINPFGDQIVLCKTPTKLAGMGRHKPFYWRKLSPPTGKTVKAINVALAEAARTMRGHPVADVWNAVASSVRPILSDSEKAARRQAQFAAADRRIEKMKRELAAM